MMIERIILLAGITITLMTLLTLFKKKQLKQAQSAASTTHMINSAETPDSKPTIIYFWSTQCNQCKTVQSPILENILSITGDNKFSVSSFNVAESPEKAKRWGVKTVPTTFVLDKDGNVQHVNNGLATEKILVQQIKGLLTYSH